MSFVTRNYGQFAYFDAQLGRPDWRAKKVLDFGGNTGNLLKDSNSTVEPENYWCIDVSIDAVGAGQRDHPTAHFIFYDRYSFEYNPEGIRDLEIPDTGTTFDYILALSVFTHTPRSEMLELVRRLKAVLKPNGVEAFTFLDPRYVPEDSGLCNLEHYMTDDNRLCNRLTLDVDSVMERACDASWCTLVNQDLYIESDALDRCLDRGQNGYLAFYTVEYIKSVFPGAEICAPVGSFPFTRQHCCVIGN